MGGTDGEDEGSKGEHASRPRPSPAQRVTLTMSKLRLSLPDEGEGAEAEGPPTDEHPLALELDTSELRRPPVESEGAADSAPLPRSPKAMPPPPAADAQLARHREREEEERRKLRLNLDELREDRFIDELPTSELEGLEEEPISDGWSRAPSSGSAPPREARKRSMTPPIPHDALDLVARRSRPPSSPRIHLKGEMADRYALGDYSGALRIAELVLGRTPGDVAALKCAESCRERLIQIFSARLASTYGGSAERIGERVPRVAVAEREIRWIGLDQRQGSLLARVDGQTSIDELADVTGLSRLDLLRTLVELVEARAIVVG